MRISEVLGLTWQDIDFAAKKITYRESDGRLVLRENITRILSIIPEVRAQIDKLQEEVFDIFTKILQTNK